MVKRRFVHLRTLRPVFAAIEMAQRSMTTDRPAVEHIRPGEVWVWTADNREGFILPRVVFDTLYQEIE